MRLIGYSGDPSGNLLEQGDGIDIESHSEIVELDDINATLTPLDVATRGITNSS